jgi:hypothetical protein
MDAIEETGSQGDGTPATPAPASDAPQTRTPQTRTPQTRTPQAHNPEARNPEARVPTTRASDRDRDAVLQRVQDAFADGRLDDTEFDQRMRAALTAKTHGELDVLLADLPAVPAPAGQAAGQAAGPIAGPAPGKYAIAYKGSVRRSGRWRVPGRYTTVVYKGDGWLDLRAAELTEPVTAIRAVAYKSTVNIIVSPGVRVEVTGFGIVQDGTEDETLGYRLPNDAPVIHVKALAYKGKVEVTTRPPERGNRRSLPS